MYLRKNWFSVKQKRTFLYNILSYIQICIYLCFDFFFFFALKMIKIGNFCLHLSYCHCLEHIQKRKKGTQKIHHIRVYLTKKKYIAELPGLDSSFNHIIFSLLQEHAYNIVLIISQQDTDIYLLAFFIPLIFRETTIFP